MRLDFTIRYSIRYSILTILVDSCLKELIFTNLDNINVSPSIVPMRTKKVYNKVINALYQSISPYIWKAQANSNDRISNHSTQADRDIRPFPVQLGAVICSTVEL